MSIYDTRLTFSPQANTASPAALMLTAALKSLSKRVEQEGQVHSRSSNTSASLMYPQQEHRLELGKNWSIATTVRPAQFALYFSIQLPCIPSGMSNHNTESIGPIALAEMMEHFFVAGYIPMLVYLHGIAH